jgi:hypothetical protein
LYTAGWTLKPARLGDAESIFVATKPDLRRRFSKLHSAHFPVAGQSLAVRPAAESGAEATAAGGEGRETGVAVSIAGVSPELHAASSPAITS